MIGSIIFFMIETRPDIVFTILIISCFAKNLSYYYSKAVKTIFCYLKVIRSTKITYKKKQREDFTIKNFSELD